MKRYELLKDLPYGYEKGTIFYKDEKDGWCLESLFNKVVVLDSFMIEFLELADFHAKYGWFKLLNNLKETSYGCIHEYENLMYEGKNCTKCKPEQEEIECKHDYHPFKWRNITSEVDTRGNFERILGGYYSEYVCLKCDKTITTYNSGVI